MAAESLGVSKTTSHRSRRVAQVVMERVERQLGTPMASGEAAAGPPAVR